jgi:hypothetical protein
LNPCPPEAFASAEGLAKIGFLFQNIDKKLSIKKK